MNLRRTRIAEFSGVTQGALGKPKAVDDVKGSSCEVAQHDLNTRSTMTFIPTYTLEMSPIEQIFWGSERADSGTRYLTRWIRWWIACVLS